VNLLAMSVRVLAILSLCVVQTLGNVQIMTPTQFGQLRDLRDMLWANVLTDEQKEAVLKSLESDRDAIVTEALSVIAAHRLRECLPTLREGLRWGSTNVRRLGNVVAAALSLADDEIGFYLRDVLSKWYSTGKTENAFLEDEVLSILVTDACRALREGKKPAFSMEDMNLRGYQKALIRYSQISRDSAIQSIVETLASARIAGHEESGLVEVLYSYGQDAVHAAVLLLSDMNSLRMTTPYGRVLLLRLIQYRADSLSEEDAAILLQVFGREDTRLVYFQSPVSLGIAVEIVEAMLQQRNAETER